MIEEKNIAQFVSSFNVPPKLETRYSFHRLFNTMFQYRFSVGWEGKLLEELHACSN